MVKINILETFIKGKRPDQSKCEDGYVIKPEFVAVIDGVTAKGNHLWENEFQSGCFAMRKIKEFLNGDVEKFCAEELFSKLSIHLKNEYDKVFNQVISEERLRACIIVYNGVYNEIWSYGDLQCMIDGKVYQDSKAVDDIASEKRAAILKKALNEGKTTEELLEDDIGRKAILKEVKKLFSYENKRCELGYPVLNGDKIIPEMIKKFSVPASCEIVLASDGYPVLKETLAESEKELSRIIKEDPLCINENPSTKGVQPGYLSFDDRCYIRFAV